MALSLTTPAVILYRGNVFTALCVQAMGPGGQNSQLQLQAIDPTGSTSSQLWQYGSDHRIYQYDGTDTPAFCIGLNGPPQSLNTLVLVVPSATDHTQQWSLSTSVPSITNVGSSGYCVNDAAGSGTPGSNVIIYPNTQTGNVEWAFTIYPSFPGQPTSS